MSTWLKRAIAGSGMTSSPVAAHEPHRREDLDAARGHLVRRSPEHSASPQRSQQLRQSSTRSSDDIRDCPPRTRWQMRLGQQQRDLPRPWPGGREADVDSGSNAAVDQRRALAPALGLEPQPRGRGAGPRALSVRERSPGSSKT